MSESPTSSDIGLDISGSTKAQKSKFTRSRNGCVTCRQRRVKCDEKRPLCGNCAKGNRDCIYPTAPASITSPTHASEDAQDYSYFDASLAAQSAAFQTAVSPNAYSTLSTPTSAVTVPLRSPNEHSEFFEPLTPGSQAMLSALPKAEQAYLRFFEQHMTFHHFFSKYDFDQFFSIMLPHAALRYPPLHYALLAFIALHHAMTRIDGKIEAFVAFHDQAVSLLRQSLAADEAETPERILTVLQLATYEEYVADWAMLIDHQNAAQNMIQNFYTPEDIMETAIGRWTLLWYLRNELITGFLAGQTTTLDQQWMQTMDVWYKARSAQVPGHLPYRVDSLFASHKVLAVGVSAVMANFIQHGMSQDELLDRAVEEQAKLTTWELQLQPLKDYTQFQVTPLARSFEASDPLSLRLIRPAIIYSGPLWPLNFLISEHLSLRLVQAMQLSSRVGSMIDPKSIIELALQLSQIIESVHSWPGTPPGALLAMKDSLGLVSVVLPVEPYYIAWICDKFSAVENLGCTTPQHLRDTLAARWGLPYVERWWYEDGDRFRPVLSNLRTFMEERKADARTQKAVNVWQLKGIYG